MSTLVIRRSSEQDAEAVGALAAESQEYMRSLGDPTDFNWEASDYLRDGFGKFPAFRGLVAETESGVVGYLLYNFGYDSNRGQRLVLIIDLFVTNSCRRQGIATALMKRAATEGQSEGAEMMVWFVFQPNSMALDFYEKLGANCLEGLVLMTLPI